MIVMDCFKWGFWFWVHWGVLLTISEAGWVQSFNLRVFFKKNLDKSPPTPLCVCVDDDGDGVDGEGICHRQPPFSKTCLSLSCMIPRWWLVAWGPVESGREFCQFSSGSLHLLGQTGCNSKDQTGVIAMEWDWRRDILFAPCVLVSVIQVTTAA